MLTQALIKKLEDQKYALDQAAIVASTDAKGIITYVNDKFCEVSGYSREELLGNTHKVVNSGEHSKIFFKELWRTIVGGNVWRGEICNRRKSGEIYWVYTTIVPFLDEGGSPTQYLSIRYEITDLKLAQKTISEQQEKLLAASRLSAIGEMAAAITHEINNPLAAIMGRAEMLKTILKSGKFTTEELISMVDHIEVTSQRIAKIVRSMKTMAHHNQDKLEAPTRVSVQSLIDDSLELCSYRFQQHDIRIDLPSVPKSLSVVGQSHQIVQVLVNLLNNSFDAIQNNEERWIRVEVTEKTSYIEISITDSGRGIPKEVQKKMFNPFFSTKNVQYGTGLGLSISQGILRQGGGTLEYDGECENTRFIVQLPRTEIPGRN